MRRLLSTLLLSSASLLPAVHAHAMTILRLDTNIILYGRVLPEDLAPFRQELSRAPVKHVVLAESPGGDLRSAYGIADLIRKNHLNTSVKGFCVSSCAVMFMAGEQRQIIEEKNYKKTILGFHAPHNKETKEISVDGVPRLREYLVKTSGGKFPPELLDKAMNIRDASDMLIFYYPEEGKQSVWFCPANARPRPKGCEKLEGDALSAGIITTLARLDVSTLDPKTETEKPGEEKTDPVDKSVEK
ncbi:hypothetical protein [Undibacterium curvum]|uniref:Uncharacterized protein n=1 Tax=Undibacterium curvum TaxID=2762294 RepID=A0ABR7A209_9BURK|nr:hypothetical protein [Undibacterium curvum]MBC3930944.1 hypothetical protein [Undibacterium curvum]